MTAAVAMTTLAALGADRLIPVLSLSLLYMTTVVAVAAKLGRWPSVGAAVLGFAAYNCSSPSRASPCTSGTGVSS